MILRIYKVQHYILECETLTSPPLSKREVESAVA